MSSGSATGWKNTSSLLIFESVEGDEDESVGFTAFFFLRIISTFLFHMQITAEDCCNLFIDYSISKNVAIYMNKI